MTGVSRPTTTAVLGRDVVEYRFDRRGDTVVVLFHGGHMNAGLALGEDVFAEAGCSVLVPSRPGYGRTPLSTGTTPAGFADVTPTWAVVRTIMRAAWRTCPLTTAGRWSRCSPGCGPVADSATTSPAPRPGRTGSPSPPS